MKRETKEVLMNLQPRAKQEAKELLINFQPLTELETQGFLSTYHLERSERLKSLFEPFTLSAEREAQEVLVRVQEVSNYCGARGLGFW